MATVWQRIKAFFEAFRSIGRSAGGETVDPSERLDHERERRRGFPGPT